MRFPTLEALRDHAEVFCLFVLCLIHGHAPRGGRCRFCGWKTGRA